MFSHIVDFGSHRVMNTEKEKDKMNLEFCKDLAISTIFHTSQNVAIECVSSYATQRKTAKRCLKKIWLFCERVNPQ